MTSLVNDSPYKLSDDIDEGLTNKVAGVPNRSSVVRIAMKDKNKHIDSDYFNTQ